MPRKTVGVLAHYQPRECRASTHVPDDAAEELVRRMICERISRKLIRMLPPSSVFLALRPNRPASYSMPDRLPSVELPGVKFKPPASAPIESAREQWDWARESWPTDLLQISPEHRSLPAAAVLPTQLSASGSSGELPL